MSNPYTASNVDLSKQRAAGGETYDPSMFSLHGRIGRVRYLAYIFIIHMGGAILIGGTIGAATAALGTPWLAAFIPLLAMIPLVAAMFIMGIRRLNDMDKSGWLSLLFLVPLVNVGVGLWILFARGTDGDNGFGAAPGPNRYVHYIAMWLMILSMLVGILAAIAMPAYQDYRARQEGQAAAAP